MQTATVAVARAIHEVGAHEAQQLACQDLVLEPFVGPFAVLVGEVLRHELVEVLLESLVPRELEDLQAGGGNIGHNSHAILIIHDFHNAGPLSVKVPLHIFLRDALELLQGARLADDGSLDR